MDRFPKKSDRLFQLSEDDRLFPPSMASTRLRDEELAQELVQEQELEGLPEIEQIIFDSLKDDPDFYVKIEEDNCIGIRNLIIKVYLDVLYDLHFKFVDGKEVHNSVITEKDWKHLKQKTLDIRNDLDDFGYSTTNREEITNEDKQFNVLKQQLENKTKETNISNTFRCSILRKK